MANLPISGLAPGAAVSDTDVLPNVQVTGVGPVKTTAAQIKTYTSASPTLVTPNLGTPTAGNLANCTNLPISTGVSGLGTSVATALAVSVGSSGSFVANGGALGTPSSGTLTNCGGFPVNNLSGLGTGVATALGSTPSGTGALALTNSPAFVTPALGVPASGTLTSCTGLPISTGVSGLGTGVGTALGVNVGSAGAFVVNGGALGTPSSGTLSSCTGLPISTGVSGLGTGVATFLATPTSANLASAVTNETGTAGSLVFSTSPTLTNITLAAGTASLAPLVITSGTNLTTAVAGAVEYDGKLEYFTPAGTARALTPSVYYYRNNSAVTLSSATGNQAILGTTSGVTLQANTIYEVEGYFELTTTGTTSHTESIGFVLATATATATAVEVNRFPLSTTATGITGIYLTSVTPVATTGAITTAQTVAYRIKGSIAIGTAGQVNPVIAFSAAPGGTSTVVAGAFFKFAPIGTTGSNVSIGTWA